MKNLIPLLLLFFPLQKIFSQDITYNLQHDGQQRSFIVHSPCQTFDCNNKLLPVVFVFHGLGQSAEEIRDYSFFNNIADIEGFVAVYPQGINNGWNVGFTIGNPTTTDDVGFTEKMIQFIYDNSNNCTGGICEGIDTNSIFSCGMSNGGFFSYHLACNLSNKIAAIASVTGSMTNSTFDNCNPLKPMPVLEIHGDADLVVPYTGSALTGAKPISHVLNYWVNHNGCPPNPGSIIFPDININDSSTVVGLSYQPCNESEILHLKVLGGGHCWPGSAVAPGLGNTNMDIDASQQIWIFFKRYVATQPSSIRERKYVDVLKLFPNPATDVLQIHFENTNREKLINVFDLTGKLLWSENVFASEKDFYLNTKNLENGIYLLQCTDEKSKSVVKFSVQH
jgi:polyhydroxybutyrate depolymerase